MEYTVRIPITGWAEITVIADSESEAVSLAYKQITSDNLDWDLSPREADVTENE